MRTIPAVLTFPLCLLAACQAPGMRSSAAARQPLVRAESLIDAFYSFDAGRLRVALADAPESQPQILYYQGWAEGGHYRVIRRQPCSVVSNGEISCAIMVKDDLIAALGTGYDVTDTFHLTVDDGRIVKVRTSSNDPPEFDQALEWLKDSRPDLLTGPCQGFFAGGPTPQECVRAVVKGFSDYRRAKRP